MTTQPPADSSNPAPLDPRVRSLRGAVGYVIGTSAGALIGWLIDSAITSSPYIGVRAGIFLGGVFGALLGAGAGWRGCAAVLVMVACAAAGAGAGLAVSKLGPDSFVSFIPAATGGIVGAFLGLALGAILFRQQQRPTH